jgi:hypothetical protein
MVAQQIQRRIKVLDKLALNLSIKVINILHFLKDCLLLPHFTWRWLRA